MSATPKDAVLGAGTTTLFKEKGAATTFQQVSGMMSIGQVGEKTPTQEQTTLEDTSKRYIAGLFDGPDKELKGKAYDGDAGQEAFFTAARARKIVIIQHQWPDGVTAEYEVVLLGYMRDETGGDKTIDWVVPCKQNGTVTWGKAAGG
ncbi:hypothetical protein [Aeromonas dhakensis]|uniref:hypothetical protein n=1 Tax=Aeromonas dhakensis TaxID=196024 RepID=UPI00300E3EBC